MLKRKSVEIVLGRSLTTQNRGKLKFFASLHIKLKRMRNSLNDVGLLMKELHDFPVIVARSRGSCVNRWHVMHHDSSWADRGSCNYFDCFCFQRLVICDVLRNSLRDLAIISCS